jgi:uncharacterized protein (DUF302 family)
MKDFLLASRLRGAQSTGSAPDTQRPFRLWMTGSLAVVMAALLPLRDVSENERNGTLRLLRHSRFDVNETVLRIENSARQHGLSVLARMEGSRPVIVLASSVGGTLIVMDHANSGLDVPLSVIVRAGAGGGADVLVASGAPASAELWCELPQAVADDLAALPAVVERALG